MKKIFSLMGVLSIFVISGNAQVNDKLEKKIKLGFAVNEFITASGFAPGTELYFGINERDQRTLAIGMYYCPEFNSIIGLTLKHEVFLFRKEQNRIEPLLFYNFIYRSNSVTDHYADIPEKFIAGTYKSFEHYLGIGIQMKLTREVFLYGGAGFGAYFGSIEKPLINPVLMNARGGNGISSIARLGVGVNLF